MSTPPMDPYKVLGVPMDAQLADIRTAHRKLILKCHPDKVADPALKAQKQDEFQKVQQAYEMLSDEEQRQKCDDILKLHNLRERMSHTKANSSAPRSPTAYREFDIRTAEPPPRSKSYRDTTPREAPPNVKIFSYTRGSSREAERGPRYYEDGRPPRRGESYSEKPSKRESERESQRDREKRDEKERKKEKERRKLEKEREREDDLRREKAAKKEAKRQREKQDDKQKKRDKEDKRRERNDAPYIEPSDEEILHKKSSSRKYDTRERSSGRDEPQPPPGVRRVYTDGPQMPHSKIHDARAYIHRAQTTGPPRSNSYHPRDPQPPAAPTPPPAPSGAFATPEEDEVRRSSARPRRGSADVPSPMPRERNIHRSSREPVDEDPIVVDASPAANRARYTNGPINESPPPSRLNRTNTMPVSGEKPSRAPPRRAQTYSEGPEVAGSRGRGRSKMYAQADIVSEDEDDYDEPPRRSKHRSRKERSPDRGQEIRYHVGGDGRTKLHSAAAYSRSLPQQKQPTYAQYDYDYEPARSTQASRPDYSRGPSYSGYKVKQGRSYGTADVAYSHFEAPAHAQYAEDRGVYAA